MNWKEWIAWIIMTYLVAVLAVGNKRGKRK